MLLGSNQSYLQYSATISNPQSPPIYLHQVFRGNFGLPHLPSSALLFTLVPHLLTSTLLRYTDFLVNEIALDGTVLHLKDDRAPNFAAAAKVSVPSVAARAGRHVLL